MTDADERIDELRDRIDALESRVSELEDKEVVTPSADTKRGLDHRDATVLGHVEQHGDPGPRKTVEYYLRLTDINQQETAKRRAKQLRKTDAFRNAVRNHEVVE